MIEGVDKSLFDKISVVLLLYPSIANVKVLFSITADSQGDGER